MTDYLNFNQDRWNRVAKDRKNAYTIPLSHEQLMAAKDKPLEVFLTVGKPVPTDWFDKLVGKKILGLASGGGQQGPLFALKGYDVTIMDYSAEQLASDHMVAEREGLTIKTIQGDMTQPFPFADESFDLVFCPVSNVYIEDLTNMWQESYRVLKKGGLLMVGYMNPWVYLYDGDQVWEQPDSDLFLTYPLPFNARELEKAGKLAISPDYGYEFSHTWEEQIGGQLRAGFAMIDFYESKDNRHRLSTYASDYLANLSIKL
ncbi:class I SAM-dependent methyltransferase [Streptococcus cuniculipharyngis]|uniref:Class I SAM-dependent methyltransferase n=1 Tax=Streptococcus cuniculipharyngis TaxID=1562651 RepID=A0A5C5SEE2_9STRE|nr:class I SAM-dependent methyltransferase [Streptococcus cuniculipharyngis]TWS99234.1 class I SAM-dependent methyltransferase [Streptococcus cuniculipharyngis]